MEQIKSLLNKFNGNPFVVAFINLIAIANFIVMLLDVNATIKIIAAVIFVVVVAVLLQRLFAYKKLKTIMLDDFCEAMNSYNLAYKKCFEQINDGTTTQVDHFDASITKLTNCIEQIASAVLNRNVCVCVKLVEPAKLTDADYRKWELLTIARSSSTKSKRRQKDSKPDIVEENTDFCSILDKNASQNNRAENVNGFISYDLDKTQKAMRANGGKYKNSHDDFEYKSTIVYPIQFETKDLPRTVVDSLFNHQTPNTIFISGFLCLDSEAKFTEEDEMFDKVALLLWHFCQSLSPLFLNYSIMRMKQGEREVHTVV